MHKLAITALAVAMGLAWSALPAIAAGTTTPPKEDKSVKEKAADTWDKTKEKTSEAWDKTKEKTVETKDKVKEKVSGDKDKAENKAERAKDKAEAKAERAKDKADAKADTAGDKIDRGVDKTKAKARDLKDKAAAKMESSEDIRHAQTALKDKGHNPGPIDGIHGPRTSAALRNYQKAENIKVTGRLDDDTRTHLLGSSASGRTSATTPSASPVTSQPSAPATPPSTTGGAAVDSKPAVPPASGQSPSAPAEKPEKTQKP